MTDANPYLSPVPSLQAEEMFEDLEMANRGLRLLGFMIDAFIVGIFTILICGSLEWCHTVFVQPTIEARHSGAVYSGTINLSPVENFVNFVRQLIFIVVGFACFHCKGCFRHDDCRKRQSAGPTEKTILNAIPAVRTDFDDSIYGTSRIYNEPDFNHQSGPTLPSRSNRKNQSR